MSYFSSGTVLRSPPKVQRNACLDSLETHLLPVPLDTKQEIGWMDCFYSAVSYMWAGLTEKACMLMRDLVNPLFLYFNMYVDIKMYNIKCNDYVGNYICENIHII